MLLPGCSGYRHRAKARNIRSFSSGSKRTYLQEAAESNLLLNDVDPVATIEAVKCLPLLILSLLSLSCDHGLEPPADPGFGTIEGRVTYVGDWPPAEELQDLRFVAMRFTPQDTSDFFKLNEMEISGSLDTDVDSDNFTLSAATAGTYFYSGVAQKFDANLLSWRPVGLYTDNGGVFSVTSGQTVSISFIVDFDNPPVFPPR